MTQVQILTNVVGRWQEGRKLQVLFGSWLMLGVCNLCAMVLHEGLLVLALLYGSETDMERKGEG